MVEDKKEIRENIWYKLFLLQNYTITEDMFIGSSLRWKSIKCYLSLVRSVYNNTFNENTKSKFTKSLVDYVRNLMNSGVEPYPTPSNVKNKKVSINTLLKSNILNSHQAREIYYPVSGKTNLPDTSIAWTREAAAHDRDKYNTGSYYKIVPEEIEQKSDFKSESGKMRKVTNPISKLNPFKFTLQKDLNLVEAFKLITNR